MSSSATSFPSGFDADFNFGQEGRLSGCFGRNVLQRLISGIDEFQRASARQGGARTLGPAMLGAFLWLDDPELVQRIEGFPHACVVITKQGRGRYQQARLEKLKPLLENGPGFPARALPELTFQVLREGTEIPVVGPSSPEPDIQLPTLRTIGYRKTGDLLAPILHTKMMLLGELWWHDEVEFGVGDVIGFRPQRLWLGSANGTSSSRENLEFGVWLDDPTLLHEAKRFLTQVLNSSEGLDPDSHDLEPDLIEPEYDEEAFAEAVYLTDNQEKEEL